MKGGAKLFRIHKFQMPNWSYNRGISLLKDVNHSIKVDPKVVEPEEVIISLNSQKIRWIAHYFERVPDKPYNFTYFEPKRDKDSLLE